MEKTDVLKYIFTSKENIKVSPRGIAMVGTIAPAGTPSFLQNVSPATKTVKYNRAAKFFDDVYIDNNVSIMYSSDYKEIYTEIKTKAGTVKSFLRVKDIDKMIIEVYSSNLKSVRAIIYPLVIFFLGVENKSNKSGSLLNSLYEGYLHNVVDDVKATGITTMTNLGVFCDAFYYMLKNKTPILKHYELTENETEYIIKMKLKSNVKLWENDMQFEIFKGLSEQEEETEEMSVEKIYQKALNGEFKINYQWDDSVLDLIPSEQKLKQYVPNDFFAMALIRIYKSYSRVLKRIENGVEEKDAIEFDDVNVLTFGNPGTGKTAGYYAIGAALGVPVYTCTSNPNTEEDEFQGKTKFINGVPENVMTPCLKGFIYGGIVLGEEIDMPDAGVVMGALGQAVESPHMIEMYGYKIKFRHPLCAFCFTKNNDANGSNQMNEAFNNRLRQTYEVNDISRENALKIFKKRGFPDAESEWVYSIYEKTIHFLSQKSSYKSVIPNLSIRTCIGALENMQDGWSPRKSVINAIVNKISSVNQTAGHEYLQIFKTMPIPQFDKEK